MTDTEQLIQVDERPEEMPPAVEVLESSLPLSVDDKSPGKMGRYLTVTVLGVVFWTFAAFSFLTLIWNIILLTLPVYYQHLGISSVQIWVTVGLLFVATPCFAFLGHGVLKFKASARMWAVIAVVGFFVLWAVLAGILEIKNPFTPPGIDATLARIVAIARFALKAFVGLIVSGTLAFFLTRPHVKEIMQRK